MSKRTAQTIIPTEILDANKKAFKSFDIYKKTAGLIERTNIAMGRKASYTTSQCSTSNSNLKCNIHGISSTQKI
jgi:hypothetical protein